MDGVRTIYRQNKEIAGKSAEWITAWRRDGAPASGRRAGQEDQQDGFQQGVEMTHFLVGE